MIESEEEHVKEMITQGYSQGELNMLDGDNEYSGWWKIIKD